MSQERHNDSFQSKTANTCLTQFTRVRDLIKREKNPNLYTDASASTTANGIDLNPNPNPTSKPSPPKNPQEFFKTFDSQRGSFLADENLTESAKAYYFTPTKNRSHEHSLEPLPRRNSNDIQELEASWSQLKSQLTVESRGQSPYKTCSSFREARSQRKVLELSSIQERRQASCEQRQQNKDSGSQNVSRLSKFVPQATIDLSGVGAVSLPTQSTPNNDDYEYFRKTDMALFRTRSDAERPRRGCESVNQDRAYRQKQPEPATTSQSPLAKSKSEKKEAPGSFLRFNRLEQRRSPKDNILTAVYSTYDTKGPQGDQNYFKHSSQKDGPTLFSNPGSLNNDIFDSCSTSVRAYVTPLKSRNSIKLDSEVFSISQPISQILLTGASMTDTNPYIPSLEGKLKPRDYVTPKKKTTKDPKTKTVTPKGSSKATTLNSSKKDAPKKKPAAPFESIEPSPATTMILSKKNSTIATEEDIARVKDYKRISSRLRSSKTTNIATIESGNQANVGSIDLYGLRTSPKKQHYIPSGVNPVSKQSKGKTSKVKERSIREDYSADVEESLSRSITDKQSNLSIQMPPVFETRNAAFSSPLKKRNMEVQTSTATTTISHPTEAGTTIHPTEAGITLPTEEKPQAAAEGGASASLQKKVQEKLMETTIKRLKINECMEESPNKEVNEEVLITPKTRLAKGDNSKMELTSLEKARMQKYKTANSSAIKASESMNNETREQVMALMSLSFSPKKSEPTPAKNMVKEKSKFGASASKKEVQEKALEGIKKKFIKNLKHHGER